MNILTRWLAPLLFNESFDIDHAPISGKANYETKLKDAAARYGRPFKCAADTMPREVFVGAKGGEKIETDKPLLPKATVTAITARRRKP